MQKIKQYGTSLCSCEGRCNHLGNLNTQLSTICKCAVIYAIRICKRAAVISGVVTG